MIDRSIHKIGVDLSYEKEFTLNGLEITKTY